LEIDYAVDIEILQVQTILFRTRGTKDQLWIFDPFKLVVDKVPIDIHGLDGMICVSKGSNKNNVSYVAISKGQQVFIIMITYKNGNLHCIGPIKFVLNSVNNPKITAMAIYTEPELDYIVCFVGTDRAMVEIWKVEDQAGYLSKISTKGPVSHLLFDSSSPMVPNHKSLFVFHGIHGTNNRLIPLVELFNIGDRFTMISIHEHYRWDGDYDAGKLLCVSFSRNNNGYFVYTIFNQFESNDSEALMLLDIFSTKSAQRMRRECFSVPEYGLIKDILPTPVTHHFPILFSTRPGKYLCADDVPSESLDIHGPLLPSLDQWFGNDPQFFPFTGSKISQIKSNRTFLDNELLVDKLFRLFDPLSCSFPPSNPNEMRQLANEIYQVEEQGPTMKYCLVQLFD
jgi:hypothetical protein